jgi:hypothetical protein
MAKGESERVRADERRRREQRIEVAAIVLKLWQSAAGIRGSGRRLQGSALHTRAIALMQTDESTDQDDENRDGGAGKGRSSCEWVPTLRCDSGANLTRRVKLR